jgi:predicted nucleotidyltransferase
MDAAFQQRLKAVAASVFPGHRILVVYAYGSRVQGRPRPDSDLDLGYYLFPDTPTKRKGLPVREEMSMAADLSDQLGLNVDLRNLGDAPLELRGRVLEEGMRIYSEDDILRVSLERSTLSFYHDYKDVFRNMHEVRLRNKAGGTKD